MNFFQVDVSGVTSPEHLGNQWLYGCKYYILEGLTLGYLDPTRNSSLFSRSLDMAVFEPYGTGQGETKSWVVFSRMVGAANDS